jgi:hypothetical protein
MVASLSGEKKFKVYMRSVVRVRYVRGFDGN